MIELKEPHYDSTFEEYAVNDWSEAVAKLLCMSEQDSNCPSKDNHWEDLRYGEERNERFRECARVALRMVHYMFENGQTGEPEFWDQLRNYGKHIATKDDD